MATIELAKMFEVKDKQDVGPQQLLNVYHLQESSPGATAGEVATAYIDTVLPLLLLIQATNLNHSVIEVTNLVDPTDFANVSIDPTPGLRVGNPFASFVAATIQFNRTRNDMKNGQKRFTAGIEADSVGAIWGAIMLSDMDDLKLAILAPWQRDAAPGVDVGNYVVIKRVCTVLPPPDPCPGYRLPVDDDELEFFNPSSGISRDTLRSQVSRKRLT